MVLPVGGGHPPAQVMSAGSVVCAHTVYLYRNPLPSCSAPVQQLFLFWTSPFSLQLVLGILVYPSADVGLQTYMSGHDTHPLLGCLFGLGHRRVTTNEKIWQGVKCQVLVASPLLSTFGGEKPLGFVIIHFVIIHVLGVFCISVVFF